MSLSNTSYYLRVRRVVVDAMRLGAWLRSWEGIGGLAAGIIPNYLYRVPFFYLVLACALCYYYYFILVFGFLKKNQFFVLFCFVLF